MEYLRYIVYALALAGACVVFFNRKKLTPAFHWTGWFLLFAGLSQISGYLLFRFTGNNVSLYNGAMLINFGLLFMIFYNLSVQPAYRKKLTFIFVSFGLLMLYFIVQAFLETFASRALTVLNIAVSIGCLLYLLEMLKFPTSQSVTKQGQFWIVAALFIHHVSGFTHWMFFELMDKVNNTTLYSYITPLLAIVLYIMFIIATFVQLNYSGNDRPNSDKRR